MKFMHRTFLLVALLFSTLFLSACRIDDTPNASATDNLRPYVIAGVMLAMEQSEAVTPERVLQVVADIRATTDLNGLVTADELMATVGQVVNLEALEPSHRFIIAQLLLKVEDVLRKEGLADTAAVSATASQVLQWAEMAARMALAMQPTA